MFPLEATLVCRWSTFFPWANSVKKTSLGLPARRAVGMIWPRSKDRLLKFSNAIRIGLTPWPPSPSSRAAATSSRTETSSATTETTSPTTTTTATATTTTTTTTPLTSRSSPVTLKRRPKLPKLPPPPRKTTSSASWALRILNLQLRIFSWEHGHHGWPLGNGRNSSEGNGTIGSAISASNEMRDFAANHVWLPKGIMMYWCTLMYHDIPWCTMMPYA